MDCFGDELKWIIGLIVLLVVSILVAMKFGERSKVGGFLALVAFLDLYVLVQIIIGSIGCL